MSETPCDIIGGPQCGALIVVNDDKVVLGWRPGRPGLPGREWAVYKRISPHAFEFVPFEKDASAATLRADGCDP